MATQQTYYSVTTTRATTSSTSDVVFGSLTFTPDANSDYLLIHRATVDVNATGSDVRYNLYNGTSNLALSNIEPTDETDRKPVGGIALESFGSSPSSMTYDGRYSAEVGTATAGMADFRAVAIKMGADDEYAESLGQSTTTADSAQVKTTLTFTPSIAGYYWILFSGEVRMSTVNSGMFVQVDFDSGTILDKSIYRPKDSSNYRMWSGSKRVYLTAASHTFEIEYARTIADGTAYLRNARIAAIPAGRFEAHYYAEQLTEQSYTGTTYTDVVTLTDTPEAVNHLIIGSTQFGGAGTTLNVFNKLIEDSTDDVEVQEEPFKAENRLSFLTFYEKTLAASSTTWKIQHKYEGAASARTDESAIMVLQLETSVSEPVEKADTESALVTTDETASVLPMLGVSDEAIIAIDEQASINVLLIADDTVLPITDEAPSALIAVASADSALITISETPTLLNTLVASDTALATIDDTVEVREFVAIDADDTTLITMGDTASIAADIAVVDSALVVLDDTASVAAYPAAADSALVALDDAASIAADIAVVDTTLATIDDTTTVNAVVDAADDVLITIDDAGVAESLSADIIEKVGEDDSLLTITESASIRAFTTTNDNATLTISDNTAALDVVLTAIEITLSLSLLSERTEVIMLAEYTELVVIDYTIVSELTLL